MMCCSFRHFKEIYYGEELKDLFNTLDLDHKIYVNNNKMIGGYTTAITSVSITTGIKLDDDTILRNLEGFHKLAKGKVAQTMDQVDVYYYAADWLARFFVTLGSPSAKHNVNWEKTPDEMAEEKNNRGRMRLGREPVLSLAPIEINLAQPDGKPAPKDEVQAARELLGVTQVRESRPIRRPDGSLWLRKRDGQPWTRKEHKRGIAAPVDRTQVGYTVTASHDLGLEIGPNGPVRRLDGLKR